MVVFLPCCCLSNSILLRTRILLMSMTFRRFSQFMHSIWQPELAARAAIPLHLHDEAYYWILDCRVVYFGHAWGINWDTEIAQLGKDFHHSVARTFRSLWNTWLFSFPSSQNPQWGYCILISILLSTRTLLTSMTFQRLARFYVRTDSLQLAVPFCISPAFAWRGLLLHS